MVNSYVQIKINNKEKDKKLYNIIIVVVSDDTFFSCQQQALVYGIL